MKILLDTHALLWFLNGDRNISDRAVNEILSEENEVLISIASLWEISIKFSLGKISIDGGFKHVVNLIHGNRFHLLPITTDHVIKVASLPFLHRDPFERLIIAQAMVENITILTRDPDFAGYRVKVLW
jgi:PIN domain nuclease of toxin-antitoxin system